MWNGSVSAGDIGLIILIGLIAIFLVDIFGAAVAGQHREPRLDEWDAEHGFEPRQGRAGRSNITRDGFGGAPTHPAPSLSRRTARADQPPKMTPASRASTDRSFVQNARSADDRRHERAPGYCIRITEGFKRPVQREPRHFSTLRSEAELTKKVER